MAKRKADIRRFKAAIWRHYRRHGRHDLAWRRTRDPYRILVSEVMLQQTQVSRVAKFYPRFVARFPNFRALARARTADVLRAWQGMGYNRRALALQKLSRVVLERFNGRLPRERAALEALPGVGKATAGAIRAFVWNEPEVFIETNIRRAFIHSFFMKRPLRRKVTDGELMRYIKRTLDEENPREWYWALMDYGAWLGAVGRAGERGNAIGRKTFANPNRRSARYRRQAPFAGSDRELRGKVLAILLRRKVATLAALTEAAQGRYERVKSVAAALIREGFLEKRGTSVSIV
jgi:A/G-specific adenine glycosylase